MSMADITTRVGSRRGFRADDAFNPALTILWHHDPTRVGEVHDLSGMLSDKPAVLSRLEPLFRPPHGGERRPLEHSAVSRRPIHLRPAPDGGIDLDPDPKLPSGALELESGPCADRRHLTRAELTNGVVLVLGRRVVLLLHLVSLEPPRKDGGEKIVGESSAVFRMRRQVREIALHGGPVLVRGETGTGKELVAAALAAARKGPYVTVNLGAVAPGNATAELFGAEGRAFTGVERRKGCFQRADGGSLFLDEIGAAPDDVQASLLRVLDSGEVQRAGGAGKKETVKVFVIAGTDADLEELVKLGKFRAPLLQRLGRHVIRIPPLRERRDDVGRLLLHFLRLELDKKDLWRLERPRRFDETPWMTTALVVRLATWDWPGNVRQLHSFVRQLLDANPDRDVLTVPAELAEQLEEPAEQLEEKTEAEPGGSRRPRDVSCEEILEALRQEGTIAQAAEFLGMSRSSLHRRIKECGFSADDWKAHGAE